MLTPLQQQLRARVAGLSQARPDTDPELVQARQQLAEATRLARAERAVAALSPEQRRRLLAAEVADVVAA